MCQLVKQHFTTGDLFSQVFTLGKQYSGVQYAYE
jgi:hypothetical protein